MRALRRFHDRNRRRAERWTAGFARDADGATAVEFAIIAVPFITIIFGILELALVFFTGSVLTQAVSDTGRLVRVGSFQSCGGADEFKALLCARMDNLMNCEANLRVDLVSASTFQSVTMPDPGDGGLDPDDPDSRVGNGIYTDTGPAEPVVLRGTFYYPLILPTVMTRLENLPGSGRHVISVSTAFRNEPFPSGGSCNGSLGDEIQKLARNAP
ncbi:MAG: TadE/TadG family type IV pilus assembly protein [Litorimonas sp.]